MRAIRLVGDRGHRRGHDHALDSARLGAGFEHGVRALHGRAHEVALGVGHGHAERARHVQHVVRLGRRDIEGAGCLEIGRDQGQPFAGAGQGAQVGRRGRVVRPTQGADHPVAGLQQRGGRVRGDETGSAADEHGIGHCRSPAG